MIWVSCNEILELRFLISCFALISLVSLWDDWFVLVSYRNMFGGDSSNPVFPTFLDESQFQYVTGGLPQLQLFGDCEFLQELITELYCFSPSKYRLNLSFFCPKTLSVNHVDFIYITPSNCLVQLFIFWTWLLCAWSIYILQL